MYGYDGSNSRSGNTTFFTNADQGLDVVADFNTGDRVYAPFLSGVEVAGSDVRVFSTVTDSEGNTVREENQYLTLKNAAGKTISVTGGIDGVNAVTMTANLGSNVNYESGVDFYGNIDTQDNTLNIGRR